MEEALQKQLFTKETFAQYNLGLMYYNGRGVPQDDCSSPNLKHARAQFNLGVMYDNGGVAKLQKSLYVVKPCYITDLQMNKKLETSGKET